MTTRRFPRTLDEAFPHGPAYGCAISRSAKSHPLETALDYALATAIGVALAFALVSWWSA